MKRILWLSQHQPLEVQGAELQRLFGEVELCHDVNPFANAREITRRYEAGGYDEAVVVAPLWVILRLTELGLRPLWAEMLEVGPCDEYHLTYRGRCMCFSRFRRIVAVEIKFEDFD